MKPIGRADGLDFYSANDTAAGPNQLLTVCRVATISNRQDRTTTVYLVQPHSFLPLLTGVLLVRVQQDNSQITIVRRSDSAPETDATIRDYDHTQISSEALLTYPLTSASFNCWRRVRQSGSILSSRA
jgi:hypothetical protein